MPRMQVHLPADLYAEVKQRGLHASALLQEAVRAEVRRQKLIGEAERYLADLIEEVGEPSPEAIACSEAFADRVERHLRRAE
jgi:post-segregation antitoxin (ccd killing protein)